MLIHISSCHHLSWGGGGECALYSPPGPATDPGHITCVKHLNFVFSACAIDAHLHQRKVKQNYLLSLNWKVRKNKLRCSPKLRGALYSSVQYVMCLSRGYLQVWPWCTSHGKRIQASTNQKWLTLASTIIIIIVSQTHKWAVDTDYNFEKDAYRSHAFDLAHDSLNHVTSLN